LYFVTAELHIQSDFYKNQMENIII
jgi:hypothetical protein